MWREMRVSESSPNDVSWLWVPAFAGTTPSVSRYVAVHNRISAPFLPVTGSAGGRATFGIVFSALAWFSGVARVISIFDPGG